MEADNNKMDFSEVECEHLDWINQVSDKIEWPVIVNMM
jgi:hypothetical protein